jgi:pyruvate,water dikinase
MANFWQEFRKRWRRQRKGPPPAVGLKGIFRGFQEVLAANNEALALMGDLEEKLAGRGSFDLQYLRACLASLDARVVELVTALRRMSGDRWPGLEAVRSRIREELWQRLEERPPLPGGPLLLRLEEAEPELLVAMGGKAANLARIKTGPRLPVPDGVVTTFAAYQRFLGRGEAGSLWERLRQRLGTLDLAGEAAAETAAAALQDLVRAQPVPPELAQALVAEARRLAGTPPQALAVRSSGAREDTAATFAGLYDTFLGVTPEEVPERWRQVVASQFGARALIYFKDQGLLLEEADMGVLIQRLVPAQAAGVMFTTCPESCNLDRLTISATWGLAAELVGGQVSPDEYQVSKADGRLLQARYGRKEYRLVVADGRLVRQPVAAELIEAPALTPADLATLVDLARALEDYFGGPQDVEWVKDESGKLLVVQSRPLRISEIQARYCMELAGAEAGAEVLLAEGRVGSLGVAAGPVFKLYGDRRLAEVPAGVVLVAPRTTPLLAPVLSRVAALVTDVGAATGHLALVAREYGVPALVDTLKAGEVLPEGEEVTVDAYNVRVYRGRVEELLRYPRRQQPQLLHAPVYGKLRALVDLIIPLTLVDPRDPEFRPENCRTYHDITRFAHERSIQVMFGLMDEVAEGRVPALRLLRLKTTLPLNLHLVDLGDGLASHESPVPPEDLLSVPMRALWRGISHPGISWAGPVPVDLSGFLHVLGQTAIRPPERFWEKTYAIVAGHYVNYACRLGYHFSSVDSYCGPIPGDNYINFNFKGGAADEPRRIRRARLISIVLERLGFEVEMHLDVVQARFRKRPAPEIEERLDLLGRLMAYVRQMDMLMANDAYIHLLAERFLAGHYERPGEEERHGEAG